MICHEIKRKKIAAKLYDIVRVCFLLIVFIMYVVLFQIIVRKSILCYNISFVLVVFSTCCSQRLSSPLIRESSCGNIAFRFLLQGVLNNFYKLFFFKTWRNVIYGLLIQFNNLGLI